MQVDCQHLQNLRQESNEMKHKLARKKIEWSKLMLELNTLLL
jgi:hypothetical protein